MVSSLQFCYLKLFTHYLYLYMLYDHPFQPTDFISLIIFPVVPTLWDSWPHNIHSTVLKSVQGLHYSNNICCSVHTMRFLTIQYALKQTEACTTTQDSCTCSGSRVMFARFVLHFLQLYIPCSHKKNKSNH